MPILLMNQKQQQQQQKHLNNCPVSSEQLNEEFMFFIIMIYTMSP